MKADTFKISPGLFTAIITLLYAAAAFTGILHHEMWRDEWQAWTIATGSGSLGELYENCRYEGHPMLWHLMLYGLKHISYDPVSMQYLHAFIGCVSVLLFTRYAPFSRFQKALFPFGYLVLFEYTMISRCYSLGMLCMILFCILYRHKAKNVLWIALVLAVMSCTSAYGLLISACAALLLGVHVRQHEGFNNTKIIALILFAAGWSFSFMQVIPETDNVVQSNFGSLANPGIVAAAFGKIFNAYTNLHDIYILPLWDLSGLLNYDPVSKLLFSAASVIIVIFAIATLSAKRFALVFFMAATAGIFLIACLSHRFFPRHMGHYFLAYIMALWIGEFYHDVPFKGKLSFWFTRLGSSIKPWLLTFFLLCQLAGGLAFFVTDLRKPFSAERKTMYFLAQVMAGSLKQYPVIASRDFMMPGFTAELDKPFYYPETGSFGTFTRWSTQRHTLTPELLKESIIKITGQYGGHCILVLDASCSGMVSKIKLPGQEIVPYAEFKDAMAYDEAYAVYFVR